VNDVYQTKSGDLWIGSDNGLFQYVKLGKKYNMIKNERKQKQTKSNKRKQNENKLDNEVSFISQVDSPIFAVAFEELTQTPVAGSANFLWRLMRATR
jgi:hypothetical protein